MSNLVVPKLVDFTNIFRSFTNITNIFRSKKWGGWHSVEKREILSHQKNISSNQLFSNL